MPLHSSVGWCLIWMLLYKYEELLERPDFCFKGAHSLLSWSFYYQFLKDTYCCYDTFHVLFLHTAQFYIDHYFRLLLFSQHDCCQWSDPHSYFWQVQCGKARVPAQNHYPVYCCCPCFLNQAIFRLEVIRQS